MKTARGQIWRKLCLVKQQKDREKRRARRDKRVNYVWSRVSLKVVDSLSGTVRRRHHDCESGYFSMRMLILKKILTNHYRRRQIEGIYLSKK